MPGGGRIDFVLNNGLAFELKPWWWQSGPNYLAASNQLNGYLAAGGYTAGAWSDFGISAGTVGVAGTFTGNGLTLNGQFVFGYDLQSSTSGLLFYQFFGGYNITPGVKGSAFNLTFTP